MKPYLAAALQMNSLPDLEKNLNQAEDLIDLAVRQGAKLVTLPENFAFLGEESLKIDIADKIAARSEQVFENNGPAISNYAAGRRISPSPLKRGKSTTKRYCLGRTDKR